MTEGISILGERYAIDIILMVHDKPGVNKTEIIRSSPNGERTRAVRVDELVEAGILEIVEGEHWRGLYYRLTEKGERIASHLSEIRSIFEEDAEE
ncbi:hypothetical protein JS82_05700 [Methanomassiliicoccaceae archaeon DOK]|nr:hypothetical protein JS82_05700 [Methanomassiliicoccaceae archaeon DOK]